MAVSRYSSVLKRRTNILDNITPTPVVQDNTRVPAGEWMPAAWLPIEWSSTVSEDSFVMSSGKVVSLDAEERVCPSGYRLRTTIASTFLTYATADVNAGVIDIRTGSTLLTAATGAVAPETVATALLARGLVEESSLVLGHDYSAATQGDVTAVIEAFISHPVGILVGDTYVWAGDWPDLTMSNYQKQHLIQFVTGLQMKVPHLAESTAATSAALNGLGAWTAVGDGTQFPDADAAGAELYVTTTQLSGLQRYRGVIAATDTVTGYALQNAPGCKNTDRTPLSDSLGTALVNEKTSIASISSAGDYYWDAEVGMLLLFTAADVQFAGATTVTYYYYDGGSAAAHRMIHLCDEARPGQHVTYDDDSNFVAVDITPGSTNMGGILGRIYKIIAEPRGLLDRVETAWSASNMTSAEQMPGTATKGYTDLITRSGETVADQIAILNIKIN